MTIDPLAYADAQSYLDTFSGSDASQKDSIDLDLLTVSRHIDHVCQRYFGRDSVAVARVFAVDYTDPCFPCPVDMALAPTLLRVDLDADGVFETTVTGAEAWPLDAQQGVELRPFTELRLPPWASQTSFLRGSRIEVTVRWGWPMVPDPIRVATVQLTGILRLQSPRATNRYDEGIGQVIGASPQARDIVERLVRPYMRYPVAVA